MKLSEEELSIVLTGLAMVEQRHEPNHPISKIAHRLWNKIYNSKGYKNALGKTKRSR